MTNTYLTGNPLGSSAPKDLFDNASNFDEAMNSTGPSFDDRFGKRRQTWAGAEYEWQQFLQNSGFEPVHLTYVDGTPLIVSRPTQLIDRAGSVYRVKLPASFPVTLSGTWATDQNLLVDVGDASLRTALAATTGPTLLGFQNPYSGSVVRTVDARLKDIYTPEDAGMIGNNVADDTAALQRWVRNIGLVGGGRIKLTEGKNYYIPGTVIVPQYVSIDLNGATLRGNRAGGSTASMFQSGYFDGSNNLVNNLSLPNEQLMLDGIHIGGGRILNAYRGFEFKNCNRTCSLEDITFENCLQAWLLTRCFSIRLVNHFAHTGSDSAVATYKCVEAINAQVFDQVRGVTDFPFEINGGAGGNGAIVFNCCDCEGGARAYYLSGNIQGVTWIGCYNEAIQGAVYDFADATGVSASWHSNYHYLIDSLIREPNDAATIMEGEWGASNAILGAGQTVGGHLYPATLNFQHPRNNIKGDVAGRFDSIAQLPSNISGGQGSNIELVATRWGSGVGDVLSKAVVRSGVLPLHYTGDAGRTFSNQVAFATHQALVPGASSITVVVDTKIVWRPDTMFCRYKFAVVDANGLTTIYGDLYGSAVKTQDGVVGKTVVASDNGGFLRLALGGFTHPTGVYTCTGTVQLLT